jgi:hypothetical protein
MSALVRTGARYASEKQVPRYARNDSQKNKDNSKDKFSGNSNDPMQRAELW